MVAVQQLPLPEKKFGLRGQKFEFRAFYSPLTQRTATFPRLSDPQGFRFRLFYASGSIGPEGGAWGGPPPKKGLVTSPPQFYERARFRDLEHQNMRKLTFGKNNF